MAIASMGWRNGGGWLVGGWVSERWSVGQWSVQALQAPQNVKRQGKIYRSFISKLTASTAMKWYGKLLNFCLYPNFYPLFSVKYNITLQHKWQTKKRKLPKTSNHDYKIILCSIKWYNQQKCIANFKDTLNNSNFWEYLCNFDIYRCPCLCSITNYQCYFLVTAWCSFQNS